MTTLQNEPTWEDRARFWENLAIQLKTEMIERGDCIAALEQAEKDEAKIIAMQAAISLLKAEAAAKDKRIAALEQALQEAQTLLTRIDQSESWLTQPLTLEIANYELRRRTSASP